MPIGSPNDHHLVLSLRIDYNYDLNMNDAVN